MVAEAGSASMRSAADPKAAWTVESFMVLI